MKRKVTIKDIAQELGTSVSTVSFVLNGREQHISKKTKDTVFETAKKLGYKKNIIAVPHNMLRAAFVTQNIEYFNAGTSFFSNVYSHLKRKSFDNKIELFLFEIQNNKKELMEKQFNNIRNMHIDIFYTNNKNIFHFLDSKNEKVILVQGGRIPDKMCIYCDDYTAGKKAAEYAYSMGHVHAGTIFPKTIKEHDRFWGFTQTFEKEGGVPDKNFQIDVSSDHKKISKEVRDYLRGEPEPPALFYCFADNIMFPAIRGCAEAGYRVPDDISLIGTDNLYWGEFALPAFTTIDLREDLFSDKLIQAAYDLYKNGSAYHLAVPVRLVERETVKQI